MSDDYEVRVRHPSGFRQDGVQYHAGETLTVSERVIESHPNSLEVVAESDDVDGADPFDADAWFDDHDGYEERIATVESGAVDAYLDEIESAERSETVKDAVDARREELE